MKKNTTIPLLLVFLVSCSNGATETKKIEIKEDINILENVNFDYENAFFDDFSNGVDSSSWYIGNHAWGNGNGGVVPDNVHYTYKEMENIIRMAILKALAILKMVDIQVQH